ncbi:MAG: CHAD domain-containing protein [Verrucomicrobiota bacterium]|jgi:CHAD domain-containing protein
MAFCFKRKETAAKAVRRLFSERAAVALGMLGRKNPLDAAHQVRREIKKLRSLLRLTRAELGDPLYRQSNDALRKAAAYLTDARDAQVRLSALNGLAAQFKAKLPRPAFPKLKAALRANCDAELRKLEDGKAFRAIGQILQEVRTRIEGADVKGKVWPVIAPGLEKSYRRGREAFQMTCDEPAPESFHAWRKRVKDLFHQLRLLRPVRPGKLNAATAKLQKLGDLLGDDHDLFLLQAFAGQWGDAEETQLLNHLIGPRQQELRKAALKVGSKFYPEKPSRFTRRMGNYWKAWREGK